MILRGVLLSFLANSIMILVFTDYLPQMIGKLFRAGRVYHRSLAVSFRFKFWEKYLCSASPTNRIYIG